MSSVPLLSFENVSKYRVDGHRRLPIVRNASFELHEGCAAGVWGLRRSGKTTLLRLAAAVELADEGYVRLHGRDVADMRTVERERLLRTDIGFVSPGDWRPGHRERVADYVALPLLSTGTTLHRAAIAARGALERVGALGIAEHFGTALSLEERVRAMLARALVNQPRLLVVDEPAAVPSLRHREELYALLGELVRTRQFALLVASEETSSLRYTDFLMSIGSGDVVRSNERTAEVVQFPRRVRSAAESPAR